MEQRRRGEKARIVRAFRAAELDVHGPPWTPMDRSGRMVEAAGVERPIRKPLTNNHLRVVAAEIRTPRCTPTLGSILFVSAHSPAMA